MKDTSYGTSAGASAEALQKIMEGMSRVCEGIAEQLALLQEEIEEVLEDANAIPDEEPVPPKKDDAPVSTGRKGAGKSTPRKTPVKKKAKATDKADTEKTVQEETANTVETDVTETTETNEPLQEEAAESTEQEEAAEDSNQPVDTGPGDKSHGDTPSASDSASVTLTMDELTSVIVAKIKQHRPNSDKIQKIIQSYGVEKLPDLPPAKYESFMADLSQL